MQQHTPMPRAAAASAIGTILEWYDFALHNAMSGLEHDPEKWEPVFGKRSCSNKELERDDDSKKHHPALVFNNAE